MRKLDQRRRLAVVLCSLAGVVPSLVLSAKEGYVSRAMIIGILCGLLTGVALLMLRRQRGLGPGC